VCVLLGFTASFAVSLIVARCFLLRGLDAPMSAAVMASAEWPIGLVSVMWDSHHLIALVFLLMAHVLISTIALVVGHALNLKMALLFVSARLDSQTHHAVILTIVDVFMEFASLTSPLV